jgi:hypothetical protein
MSEQQAVQQPLLQSSSSCEDTACFARLEELYLRALHACKINDPTFNNFLQQYSDFLLQGLSMLRDKIKVDPISALSSCQRWLTVLESQWKTDADDSSIVKLRHQLFEQCNFELFPLLVALYPYAPSLSHRVPTLSSLFSILYLTLSPCPLFVRIIPLHRVFSVCV